MADMARWQATIVDDAGNIVPEPDLEVRREIPGQPLAAIKPNRDGSGSLGNPFVGGLDGFVYFHVAGGSYQITASKGAFERIWRYVAIGTASELDRDVVEGIPLSYLDTDGTLAANSDEKVATQKAVKTAIVDAAVGLFDDRGSYDASGNVFPSTGGSGTAGAILKGDIWLISVAGTLGGVAVTIGDQVRALADTPGQTAGNWAISEANIVGAVTLTATQTLTNKTLTSPVINTPTGIVKGDVGLGNVDNTSDANKPVSTAQQTALDLKANLASPTFTGTPAVPTAAPGTNTTQAASTGFVKAAIDVVLGGVASAFDTLSEIATDLGLKLVKSANLSDVASAATAFANIKQAATDAATGVVEFATTAETLAGTDATRANTPDGLAALWEKGADVASAGAISLGEGGYFHITGTTTITDIDFATPKDGREATLVFDGIVTLTHHATTLVLPSGGDITTAAGDSCRVVQDASDNVRVVSYTKADGSALVGGAGGFTAATQAQQEAASSNLVGTTPGVQHFHPSAAKAHGKANVSGTVIVSYNVTSVTDGGTGIITWTWATDFSTADYAALASSQHAASSLRCAQPNTPAAGSVIVNVVSQTPALADPDTAHLIAAFGDFA